MKKTSLHLLLTLCALTALALSPRLLADETKVTADLLSTCPVSGEKLGGMGAPFAFTYQGQEVKLCCKGCKNDFDKNPEKYIALIRAADKK